MKKIFRADRRLNVWAAVVALASLSMSGCFWRGEKTQPAFTVRSADAGAQTNLVITPAKSSVGRVASVNKAGNFAVINYPIGQVPANDTLLSIFHGGQKVGEIKISGPAADNFTVGDITSGTAQDGDEVRAE